MVARGGEYFKILCRCISCTVELLVAQMDSAQRKTVYGRRIMANLFPPETVEVGDYMVDTDLYGFEGNVHRIADYLAVIFYWIFGSNTVSGA